MPIKFSCPHCKKMLSVKDHLAGKKGPCPNPECKKILTVPMESTPVAAAPAPKATKPPASDPAPATKNGSPVAKDPSPVPPEDAEAAAAAALADEPLPVEETASTTTIEFNCPQCDEPLSLSSDLAGKRAPCPECKRIIKVPELKKQEKADWRKTNAQGLPSGARRPDEVVPEGAWGTATSATKVSREALEEADVLPGRRQPLTVRQKIMRGVLVAGGVGFVVVFLIASIALWRSWRSGSALTDVQEIAVSQAAVANQFDKESAAAGSKMPERATREADAKLARLRAGALYASMGEYHLRSRQAGSAEQAQDQFRKAVDVLTPEDNSSVKENERDAILAGIALLQVDLGGTADEVTNTTHLKWNDAQSTVGKTLRAMRNPEARLEAFRAVCVRLIARKQPDRALALASQICDPPAEKAEAVAVAGLELLTAKDQPRAERAANDALAPFKQEGDRPTLSSSVVALATAMNQTLPPAKMGEEDPLAVGQAEGLARSDVNAARQKVAALMNPVAKLRAYTALAAVGELKSDNPDLEAAIKLASSDLPQKAAHSWLRLRVVELASRAGIASEQLDGVISAMDDRDLAGRARLAILRQRLKAGQKADDSPLLSETPPTLSRYLARQLIARQRGKADGDKLPPEERAFVAVGALLASVSD